MEKKFFKSREAAVSQNRAMEPETILKNGASSKSQTSREKFLRRCFSILALVVLFFFINACSKNEGKVNVVNDSFLTRDIIKKVVIENSSNVAIVNENRTIDRGSSHTFTVESGDDYRVKVTDNLGYTWTSPKFNLGKGTTRTATFTGISVRMD